MVFMHCGKCGNMRRWSVSDGCVEFIRESYVCEGDYVDGGWVYVCGGGAKLDKC